MTARKWSPMIEIATVWPNSGEVARMAAAARERGVRLVLTKEPVSRAPSAAEVTEPRDGQVHVVTGVSCGCRQFAQSGGCQHWALLVDTLGWTPETVREGEEAAAAA